MTGAPTDASSECGHPANELLDFHVNGSLEGEEAAMVAAHVAECATCARDVRELMSLSESIAAHGVAPATAWPRGRLVLGALGAAAAVLVVGLLVSRLLGPEPVETRIAAAPERSAAPAGVVVPLDLGAGEMREAGAGPPVLKMEPGVSGVRLTLRAPVVAGGKLLIGIRGPADEEIVAAEALPQRDEMGRVAIEVPASRFAAPGNYRVVLTPDGPDTSAGPFSYPFEVRLAAGPG